MRRLLSYRLRPIPMQPTLARVPEHYVLLFRYDESNFLLGQLSRVAQHLLPQSRMINTTWFCLFKKRKVQEKLVVVLRAIAARIRRKRYWTQRHPRSSGKGNLRAGLRRCHRTLRAQPQLRLISASSQFRSRQAADHSSAVEPFIAFFDVVRIAVGNG